VGVTVDESGNEETPTAIDLFHIRWNVRLALGTDERECAFLNDDTVRPDGPNCARKAANVT
jgi:hypothetical protein